MNQRRPFVTGNMNPFPFGNDLSPEQQKIVDDYMSLQSKFMEEEDNQERFNQVDRYIKQFKYIADAMYEHPLVKQFLEKKNRGIELNDVLPYIVPAVIDSMLNKKDFDAANVANVSVGIASQILEHLKLETT